MIYIKDQRVSIWTIEDKGNWTSVKMGTSRKDKQTGEYKNSSWSFVRFVGSAHKKASQLTEKCRVTITSGGMSLEPYEKNGERVWPKTPQIVVFDFEFTEDKAPSSRMDTPPSVESEELPF